MIYSALGWRRPTNLNHEHVRLGVRKAEIVPVTGAAHRPRSHGTVEKSYSMSGQPG